MPYILPLLPARILWSLGCVTLPVLITGAIGQDPSSAQQCGAPSRVPGTYSQDREVTSSCMKDPKEGEKMEFMRTWLWGHLVLTSDLGYG
jgi:hypothetical protein